MCGIVGFLSQPSEQAGAEWERTVRSMAGTLVHRGPDAEGYWVASGEGIALGHRRLSVIDLSPAGHQPMVSQSGRYVAVFNGEIYNYRELRQRLAPDAVFRGNSDTEVLLAATERYGVEKAVREFNGMFAFAIWDRRERVLTLARDRCGEKPLYYGWMRDAFVFGSELKAIRRHTSFSSAISRDAVAMLMRYGYVPAPYSIYEGVFKLPPASLLRIPAAGSTPLPQPVPYWSAQQVAETGVRSELDCSDEEAIERFDALLTDSVRLRMMADVPLGASLSGGIDSATVVALMQKCSARPVKTFTIGFSESGYDEAVHAAKVAQHLGCDHTQLYVEPSAAMDVIPSLPTLYDEPFADSSQIPTHIVSRLARQQVTVSLTGDGGDEVFGGYTRYLWAQSIWRSCGWMPQVLRQCLASALLAAPHRAWELVFRALAPLLPVRVRQSHPADKIERLAAILPAPDANSLYLGLITQWHDAASVAVGASLRTPDLETFRRGLAIPDFARRMMYLDTVTYLPNDILTKLDRASMGVSLECRAPFLDHRLIELAWRLPVRMKIREGETKWLLRQVLHRYVPAALVTRPKTGFAIPLHEWLRGPLREWAEDLLDARRLRGEGFLDPVPVRKRWAEHLAGRHNHTPLIWSVLMFESWLECA
jgi:asparagine synthase (glutamine-hydrolysing)